MSLWEQHEVSETDENPDLFLEKLSQLGEGSYGSVFKARLKKSGDIVAVKRIEVDDDPDIILKEIRLLRNCEHVNVVKYMGSFFLRQESSLLIMMEYCEGGSVLDIMNATKYHLEEKQISSILKGTLSGLNYLHGMNMIHRDLKCGNILLDKAGHAKLADFGVSAQLTQTADKRKSVIGTPYWMAPEVIQETQYDTKADIWSLGVTAIEMAERKPPHSNVHPMRVIFMIPMQPPPKLAKPENWSDAFSDFVATCLKKNPKERPNCTELIQHAFFKDAPSHTIVGELIENAAMQVMQGDMFAEKRASEAAEDEVEDSGTIVQGGTTVFHGGEISDFDDSTLVLPSEGKKNGAPTNYRPAFLDSFVSLSTEEAGGSFVTGTLHMPTDHEAVANTVRKETDALMVEWLMPIPEAQLEKMNKLELQEAASKLDAELKASLDEVQRRYNMAMGPIESRMGLLN